MNGRDRIHRIIMYTPCGVLSNESLFKMINILLSMLSLQISPIFWTIREVKVTTLNWGLIGHDKSQKCLTMMTISKDHLMENGIYCILYTTIS